ncbi:TPA: hypothetical protein ACNRGP_005227, partial [Escherichia coli]
KKACQSTEIIVSTIIMMNIATWRYKERLAPDISLTLRQYLQNGVCLHPGILQFVQLDLRLIFVSCIINGLPFPLV